MIWIEAKPSQHKLGVNVIIIVAMITLAEFSRICDCRKQHLNGCTMHWILQELTNLSSNEPTPSATSCAVGVVPSKCVYIEVLPSVLPILFVQQNVWSHMILSFAALIVSSRKSDILVSSLHLTSLPLPDSLPSELHSFSSLSLISPLKNL